MMARCLLTAAVTDRTRAQQGESGHLGISLHCAGLIVKNSLYKGSAERDTVAVWNIVVRILLLSARLITRCRSCCTSAVRMAGCYGGRRLPISQPDRAQAVVRFRMLLRWSDISETPFRGMTQPIGDALSPSGYSCSF
ncbi:hypothetical protein BDW22DRAFT_800902 [Trametopsis cervina]|nr:hypothetical protein BDW22DRAFT_800902 [Trametopsis cervina]